MISFFDKGKSFSEDLPFFILLIYNIHQLAFDWAHGVIFDGKGNYELTEESKRCTI